MEDLIQENMELAHFDEHGYQLELKHIEPLSLTLNTNPLVSYLWKLEPT
jgi:predicted secreted protein